MDIVRRVLHECLVPRGMKKSGKLSSGGGVPWHTCTSRGAQTHGGREGIHEGWSSSVDPREKSPDGIPIQTSESLDGTGVGSTGTRTTSSYFRVWRTVLFESSY